MNRPPEPPATTAESPAFLAGGGEMGERIRNFDWAGTPLGPPQVWPQSLRTAVRIMLTSRQPIWIGWGEHLIYLYNDAYLSIIGGKHPDALGRPTMDVWTELRDVIGPMLSSAMEGDEGIYVESQLLIMERHGYREETYYTFSYSPISDEEGRAAGIICANTDDTQRVIGERQLALLRNLGARATDARTWQEACMRSAVALGANARDLPFAMIYTTDSDGSRLSLAGTSGIARGHAAAPESIDVGEHGFWPFADALAGREPVVVDGLGDWWAPLPTGDWEVPPTRAALVPIAATGRTGPAGVLVVGLNPFRVFDDGYRNFLSLVAGQVSASIGSAHAYAEERRRAEALAEIDRAKTTFFSNVSHEFRTPLTLMLGPVEDMLDHSHTELTPAAKGQLEVVHRNSLRLLKLVNTMLDFSRIEAGRIELTYEPLDLPAYTAELASTFRAAIERAGLRFEVHCSSLPETAYVDPDMWEKIVFNLLSNAFKFTHEGAIAVTLATHDGRARLEVRDTGVGIPATELNRVFDRFHRVNESRGRTHEGTGIGLALVQELVKLHGGSVGVQSALDEGTCFTVDLPLGRAHLDPDRVSARSSARSSTSGADVFVQEMLRWLPEVERDRDVEQSWSRAALPMTSTLVPQRESVGDRPRILWADDNADLREYVRRLLSERFDVEAVADGEQALASARSHPPDLVLSDVMMPRLDGFGLVRALREDPELRDIPIILLSARAGEEARVEGVQIGADDYLVKPFSAREVLARVDSHVRMARVRREVEHALRKKTEELEEQDRRKDLFLATLGHELRNPLAALDLGLRLLAEGHDRSVFEESMSRNLRQLEVIVDDLLDVSRITQGKVQLRTEPTDLRELARMAIEAARPSAEAKGQTLVADLDGPQLVEVDTTRIGQVLGNLLSNSVKYTQPGGAIRVTLRAKGGEAVVSVDDDGRGLHESDLDPIFETFTQLDPESGGLGIGLPLARGLVELHGGTLAVESDGVGEGSTFRVRIPLCEREKPAPSEDPARLERLPEALRVVIVDDQADSADSLVLLLRARGCQATALYSGEELLARHAELRPHIVFLDLGLPGISGYEAAEKLRREDREGATSLVAMTGFGDERAKNRAEAAGFERRLVKPVDLDEVHELLLDRARRDL